MMLELNPITIESSELVEQTYNFWLTDNEHIRSPFPVYIHSRLKQLATQQFFEWASGLNPKAKDEINDEIVGEKFEEIIFETALGLVVTEDEKITIKYPFLPRTGDRIYENAELKSGESIIVDRNLIKEGDFSYMAVRLEKIDNKDTWETKFQLPE